MFCELVIGVRQTGFVFRATSLKFRVVNIIRVRECLAITVAICLEIINWYLCPTATLVNQKHKKIEDVHILKKFLFPQ